MVTDTFDAVIASGALMAVAGLVSFFLGEMAAGFMAMAGSMALIAVGMIHMAHMINNGN